MTIAAFVVSVVALLVSGLSALYTRRQATAAEQTAQLEAARWHKEETPSISSGEIRQPGSWFQLYFRLTDTPPLQRVEAEIVDTKGVSFRPGIDGVPPRRSGKALDAFYVPEFANVKGKDLLETGDALYWVIELDDDRADKAHIRLTCTAGKDRMWVIHREVEIPVVPTVW